MFNIFTDTKAKYINNIMHTNADFINLNLEQKILIFASSAHYVRFICCNRV